MINNPKPTQYEVKNDSLWVKENADHSKCSCSSTIHEAISFGQGILDMHGFWEIPCYHCARRHEKEHPESEECWPHSIEYLKKHEHNKPLLFTFVRMLFQDFMKFIWKCIKGIFEFILGIVVLSIMVVVSMNVFAVIGMVGLGLLSYVFPNVLYAEEIVSPYIESFPILGFLGFLMFMLTFGVIKIFLTIFNGINCFKNYLKCKWNKTKNIVSLTKN